MSGAIWHIGMSSALYAADPGSIPDEMLFSLKFEFQHFKWAHNDPFLYVFVCAQISTMFHIHKKCLSLLNAALKLQRKLRGRSLMQLKSILIRSLTWQWHLFVSWMAFMHLNTRLVWYLNPRLIRTYLIFSGSIFCSDIRDLRKRPASRTGLSNQRDSGQGE